MPLRRISLAVACSLALTISAIAQQRVSPEDQAIDTLRIGRPNDGDNDIVDNWANKELGILRQALSDPVLMDRAGVDFVAAFMRQWNHPENTAEFKIKFAERVGRLFLTEYRKGAALNERVARALARVLLDLKSAFTRDTLIAGLSFPDQAVRYLSAQGLREIQDDIAADAGRIASTLNAIAQAGAIETSDVVVARIYRAVEFDGFPTESLNAVATILEGRIQQLRAGAELGRGETSALDYLAEAAQAGKLTEPMRIQAIKLVAPLLRIHTMRYAETTEEQEIAAIQATIDASEGLLKRLVNPTDAPVLSEKMQRGGDTAVLEMKIELSRWIGSAETPGILNKAPWDVPVGAP